MRQWTREQIETANAVYHKMEAALYDQQHPEILWCEKSNWEDFFSRWAKGQSGPKTVVDVGAGTGFIFNIAQDYLRPGDTFLATDLSSEMLAVAEAKRKRFDIVYSSLVGPADKLPVADGSADLVTINSALHHFPDPRTAVTEAFRILKPGGLLVVMHEPNLAFARSKFLVWMAKNVSRINVILNKRKKKELKNDYTPVFAAVNSELLKLKLVGASLTNAEIQSMVDVHSPTATGHYEPIGFDLSTFIDTAPFGVVRFDTYNFLGKLDPTTSLWKRAFNGALKTVLPGKGALFTVVLKKND